MTTAATSLLGLALPVTGELSGTWGDTVNNSITSLLDSAIAGTTTLSTDADVTLTTTTLFSNQAREAIILWTAAGTVTRTITAPAQSKTYVVINKSSTQSIKLVGVGPTAGVTLVAGEFAVVAWNGTDFVKIANASGAGVFTTLSASGTVSGAGFSAYLASPPAIGGTAPAAGAFTTISASGAVSGAGFNAYLASPPAIGSTAPAAGAFTTLTASSNIVGRYNPRVVSTASTATLSPDISAYDQYDLTAQAVALTIAAPVGTPVDGNKIIFRILDNGTAQTLSWNATYTPIGVFLPTMTTQSKMLYVGCIYNATNTRWDVVLVTTQV